MRYRKLIAVALCTIILSLCVLPVFAEESTSHITSAYMLEGNLYYCNSKTGEVVLNNVKPMVGKDSVATELSKKIEYTETRLFSKCLFLADGTQIEYDWLNNYADGKVRFIAVEQENGEISILYLKFV